MIVDHKPGHTAQTLFAMPSTAPANVGPRIPGSEVHRWFSDASRSLKSPNLPACSIIATKIADARDRPGEPPWSIDTYRSARSLLKHLRIDRDLAKAKGATDHEMQRWALVIDRVEGAVDPILNHVKPNDVQDLAQQIASIARYAWQDTGCVPAGISKDGPIVAFVKMALDYLGHDRDERTIERYLSR